MTKLTKKECKIIIEQNKENTSYFDESMTYEEMYNMLRYKMAFGEAETRVIIASLVLSGAKFK